MKLVEKNLSKEKPTFQIISFFLLDIFRNSIHLRDKLCEGKTVKCSHSNGHITGMVRPILWQKLASKRKYYGKTHKSYVSYNFYILK